MIYIFWVFAFQHLASNKFKEVRLSIPFKFWTQVLESVLLPGFLRLDSPYISLLTPQSSSDLVVQLHHNALNKVREPNPQWKYSSTELSKEEKQLQSAIKGQLVHESKRTKLPLQCEILYCLEDVQM